MSTTEIQGILISRVDILVGREIAFQQYSEIHATAPSIAGKLRLAISVVNDSITRLLASGVIVYAGSVKIDGGRSYPAYVIATSSGHG